MVRREIVLVVLAALAYFGVRNLTAGSADVAFANADRIEAAEAWLGIRWEAALQGAIIGANALVTLANWVYIWGHWPVIVSAGVWLFSHRRDRYYLLRNAMFVSGAIGFLFFALFPVAPPRLADPALVDTVTEHSYAYRALQPPGLTNQYAAFPSLHLGWNLLVGMALYSASRRRAVRAFAVVMPAAMALAVVATANHYVLDAAGGVALVLAAHAACRRGPDVATLVRRAVRRRASRRERSRQPPRGRAPRPQPRRG